MLRDKGLKITNYREESLNEMRDKKCVKRAVENLRQMNTDQSLRFAVDRMEREMKYNRQIREQKELEYDKTIKLLRLTNISQKEKE